MIRVYTCSDSQKVAQAIDQFEKYTDEYIKISVEDRLVMVRKPDQLYKYILAIVGTAAWTAILVPELGLTVHQQQSFLEDINKVVKDKSSFSTAVAVFTHSPSIYYQGYIDNVIQLG